MNVEVRNLLVTIVAVVGEKPIATFLDTHHTRNGTDGTEEFGNLRIRSLFREVIHRYVRNLGNHEHVDWSLRIDVVKRENVFVLINFVAGDFPT